MNQVHKRREILLAMAGILVGATIFGWTQQVAKIGQASANTRLSEAKVTSSFVPTPAAGKSPDLKPVTSTHLLSALPTSAKVRAVVPRSKRSLALAHLTDDGVVLPPPPDPPGTLPEHRSGSRSYSYKSDQSESRKRSLSIDDSIKLVGLLDGKAIFRIRPDIAAARNLKRAFTLGQGDQYAGLKVETVGDRSVTVSDGTAISTKELDPIN